MCQNLYKKICKTGKSEIFIGQTTQWSTIWHKFKVKWFSKHGEMSGTKRTNRTQKWPKSASRCNWQELFQNLYVSFNKAIETEIFLIYSTLNKEQNSIKIRANKDVYTEKQINQTCKTQTVWQHGKTGFRTGRWNCPIYGNFFVANLKLKIYPVQGNIWNKRW